MTRDVVVTHLNGLDIHQWLTLADNLACSLEEIVNAPDVELVDWAGARRDLTSYWDARHGKGDRER